MKNSIFLISIFIIMIMNIGFASATDYTTITTVTTKTLYMSGVPITTTVLTITTVVPVSAVSSTQTSAQTSISTITTTISTTETITKTVYQTSTDSVYKSLYSAMLRISYLEEVTSKQSAQIASLESENSQIKSQNSVYMTSVSVLLNSINTLSSQVSSLEYENAALSGQLSYYKGNYETLYSVVAMQFNVSNNASELISSIQAQKEAAKRRNLAAGISIFLAIVGAMFVYSRYVNYRTMKKKRKPPF